MSISLFAPKGVKFYSLFNQMAGIIEEMYQLYTSSTQQHDEASLSSTLAEIKYKRESSQTAAHKVSIELGKNFITPLDREDIYTLAKALDGISDYIYTMARQRVNYRLLELPEQSLAFAQKLGTALSRLYPIIEKLSDTANIEKLAQPCKQMKVILDGCYAITDVAKTELMQRSGDNVIEVVKLIDHFECASTLTGKCKDAGKTIDNIIIKYS